MKMEQKAKWIWIQESRPNQWVELERSFDLEAIPQSAVAEIAVDSKYTLWVNGTLCVVDGGLNRGPACGKGYIDRVDVYKRQELHHFPLSPVKGRCPSPGTLGEFTIRHR